MKVENMTNSKGNKVVNQFIIKGENDIGSFEIFQSYKTVIVKKQYGCLLDGAGIYLDENSWDYSITTGKYRNLFLGESKAEIQQEIINQVCDFLGIENDKENYLLNSCDEQGRINFLELNKKPLGV